MIAFLISFFATLYLTLLASRAVHYWKLAYAQAKKITLQQVRLADQDAQIAELQRMLAASEAERAKMFQTITQGVETVREQDATIAELRNWSAIVMPKAMKSTVGRWN